MKKTVDQKLLSRKQIAFGVLSALAFYTFMSIVLVPYTFSANPSIAQMQACFAAIPVATTFWFAVNMFMVVLADQRKQKKKGH